LYLLIHSLPSHANEAGSVFLVFVNTCWLCSGSWRVSSSGSFVYILLIFFRYQDDPYLAYRPAFARSLPVQILLTGVVLTLTAVLFIHLLFTAQYHWPLAPVNYVLQLSGVTILLISLIATINVVLSATLSESIKWPYMLSYVAVNVPPLNLDPDEDGWSFSEKATWLLMTASTSGLIQVRPVAIPHSYPTYDILLDHTYPILNASLSFQAGRKINFYTIRPTSHRRNRHATSPYQLQSCSEQYLLRRTERLQRNFVPPLHYRSLRLGLPGQSSTSLAN
jgi:hypothetical protein